MNNTPNTNNDNTLNNDAVVIDEQVVNTLSTTKVVNDTIVEKYKFPEKADIDRNLIRPQVITPVQDIKSFLNRPIKLRAGSWTTATSGTFIAIDLPFEALSNTIYTAKVQGFLNFRAKAVVRLQVNANRFVQGRLIMHYIPQAQISGMYPANRNLNLTTITQQPNVQLDANTESEAILEIPYTSPKLYYDLTTGDGEMGALYVSVYQALNYGVGGVDADYTLWLHFEDVELEIPTIPGTFLTQSGKIKSKIRRKARIEPADEELKQSGNGPISSFSKVIGDVADTVSNWKIPLVSEVAGEVSWVAKAVTGVASFFGFSNPRSESLHDGFKYSIWNHSQNNNLGNHAEMLAYSGDNKLETLPGLGPTDLDEAAINYIVSKDVFFDSFTWSQASIAGDQISTVTINKGTFKSETVVNDGANFWTIAYHTPVSFFQNYFKYWRGSVKITLKFVKTEFHTGRIAVSYYPHPNQTYPGVISIDDTNYLLRDIVDLRDGNECSFVIPYTNNNPWIDRDDQIGTFFVHIINPLVSPDGCATSIEVLMEVSAGSDFEVACFEPLATREFTPMVVDNAAFVSQSGSLPSNPVIGKSDAIGNGVINQYDLAPSKYVMGEKVVSVYNIMKRFTRLFQYNTAATHTGMTLNPFEINAMGSGISGAAYSISNFTNDTISIFTSFYAYSRGSVNMRVVEKSNDSTFDKNNRFSSTLVNKTTTAAYGPTAATDLYNSTDAFQTSNTDLGCHIAMPPYMELHCRLNRLNTSTNANYATYAPPNDEYTNDLSVSISMVDTTTSMEVYKSAGDDYQVGFFIGIPPLIVST